MTLQKSNNIPESLHKRLSVQVSLTGLSFLIENSTGTMPLFYAEKSFQDTLAPEELLNELQYFFSENELLNHSFSEIDVIYNTPIYTLVPDTLFEEKKASDYLKFNVKILANDFVANDILKSKDLVTVYVPYININNYFFDTFGSFDYYHAVTILLERLLDVEKNTGQKKVYIDVESSFFHLMAIDNGYLQLCNTYTYKTSEDFLYYVLFAMEQLKLSPEKVEVVVFGKITEKDTLYGLLYQYIRNVSFLDSKHTEIVNSETGITHSNFLLKNII